ncbi:MAG: hypothetical protein OXH00_21055 [Candidatus Poribacteria bacterium]|nr:hypothetical protein [Candidatus Poribacteria bacterium]
MAEQNGNENVAETQGQTEAASGVIINASQLQSIDISERFTRTKTETGWRIQLGASARVVVNFMTSMRKLEITLMQDDCIERDGDDLILIRNQSADAYRSQRGVSSSPLARSNERPSASDASEN